MDVSGSVITILSGKACSGKKLYGVEILNEGAGVSIDDAVGTVVDALYGIIEQTEVHAGGY